jgi:hypothetical protein
MTTGFRAELLGVLDSIATKATALMRSVTAKPVAERVQSTSPNQQNGSEIKSAGLPEETDEEDAAA